MNGFELNKILAAVLITFLFIFGVGKFTDFLFHVEKPAQTAYKMDNLESVAKTASGTVAQVDVSQLLSLGTVEHGAQVFKKCSACHMIAAGGKNMIGPNLWGVIGRQTAAVSGYKYSKALAAYGKDWSFAEMNGFLIKPSAHIKGTKMAFAGLRKEKDRASVILYMNSKSDSPVPTP